MHKRSMLWAGAGVLLLSLPIPEAAAGAERLALRLLNRGTLAQEREVEPARPRLGERR